MKVKYDKETDVLYINFNDQQVHESDEDKPGIIIDYAADGHIVGIELLDASKQTAQPSKFEYEVS